MINKNAYILRGIPGSGKSTLARIIAQSTDRFDAYRRVFSTDFYFIGPNGEYLFDRSKLGEYHKANAKTFALACAEGVSPVICDNTNMALSEMAPYIKAAKDNDYTISVITVGNPKDPKHQTECAKRNIHGVTIEIIKRMAERFEL